MLRKTGAARVKKRNSIPPVLWLPVAFFVFLIIGAVQRQVPREFAIVYLASSLLTALFYKHDKTKAVRGEWRTPEMTLHLLDLLCGWPGGLIAQQLCRHKNHKLSFQITFWFCTALHLAFWGWVFVNLPAESDFGAFIERILHPQKLRST